MIRCIDMVQETVLKKSEEKSIDKLEPLVEVKKYRSIHIEWRSSIKALTLLSYCNHKTLKKPKLKFSNT